MILGVAFADWIALIAGVLQFPSQVLQVVKYFKATPEEQREALMQAIQQQADSFAKTGRPTWG